MPRKARIDAPGAVHHIIARGIERGKIFRDDEDREDFIERLSTVVTETRTRCLAWALIPNHFHLLLKTGDEPIATLMRRLLTGFAAGHNRRHGRSGHLFQNRYKSILCQEDLYLKELVRYIHLNPLRAGLVADMAALDRYRYAGHSYLMGKQENGWQAVDDVLAFFGDDRRSARKRYRLFVMEGVGLGSQPVLTGGGLVRSAGGWSAVQYLRRAGVFQKSDERILGDGDFVETVLAGAEESLNNRYRLASKGIGFEQVAAVVADLLSVDPQALIGRSKERVIARGRALLCYWLATELGMPMTAVADRLGIAAPTVSVAVKRGKEIVRDEKLSLLELLNVNM
jgi:REP element-mobilizing transposase RayT